MDENKAHILVIDDDQRIRELISEFLQQNNLWVSHAASAPEAREKMRSLIFDLIVLDVMMPQETGLDFMQTLQDMPERPPVLMLTALSKTEERIQGLEAGADDYLPKPFAPKELLLRIEKLLSRTYTDTSATMSVKMGDFVFENAILTHKGERVPLSTSDENLLKLLASQPHQIVSRETLAKRCGLESVRAVDVRMNRLRQKIEPDPRKPIFLQTARGVGYIFKPS